MNNILDFTEQPMMDETIQQYEYFQYEPITGAKLNQTGDIRINIESQDVFTHPSMSYLVMEGRLTKADDTSYANDDLVAITNNGMMHLFSSIKYQLANQDIEYLLYPGQATTMMGLLKYPDDFSKSQGLNQLWAKDTSTMADNDNIGFNTRRQYLIEQPDTKGTFSFKIPLKHIFGFCEDYDKIVYGMRHTLSMIRKKDDDAIFRAAGVAAGKIDITRLTWYVPHVLPSDASKFMIIKNIESKVKIPINFRMRQCDEINVQQATTFNWRLSIRTSPEKPRFIVVGFQTDKNGSQTTNPSTFDNLDVKNMYIMLNSERYPTIDYQLAFPDQQFSRAYGDAACFRSKFYSVDELASNPNISPSDYKSLYPLFVFDVSHQSEKLKTSTIDVQIRAFFGKSAPVGTLAYALVISDKMFQFQSDGNKINVL